MKLACEIGRVANKMAEVFFVDNDPAHSFYGIDCFRFVTATPFSIIQMKIYRFLQKLPQL